MPSKNINVLVVDDSSFMRLVITDILSVDHHIKVVGTAGDGKEACDKIKALSPDVVVMDIVMPEYDGLYAVRRIMKETPTPVLILSSLGNTNPETVFDAMNAGAFDFLNKPVSSMGSKIRNIENQLIYKVKEASAVDLKRLSSKNVKKNSNLHTFSSLSGFDAFIIGSSTGGTGALEEILWRLPENFPIPIVIAQHMPAGFVHSFARRLNEILPFTVKVSSKGEELLPGIVYLLDGTVNTTVVKDFNKVRFDISNDTYPEFNFPSVDCLMSSAAKVYGNRCIAAILTGMGKDGASGMKELHSCGSYTIAQDEKSCVVFGMPKAAIDKRGVKSVLPLHEIPGFIVSCLS